MNQFPSDFFWGGATAANQYEGGYNQGNKALTISDVLTGGAYKKPRKISYVVPHTGEKGYVERIPGKPMTFPQGAVPTILEDEYYPSHVATDFYNHYQEDIALMAEMGFKVFRLSMSWARIFPDLKSETPNPEGLQFYDNVINECLKYNIEPLVTMEHFEVPLELVFDYNGWENRQVVELFVKFTTTLMNHFKGRVKYWLTFNEINMMEFNLLSVTGIINVNKNSKANAAHHKFLASALTVKAAREIDSSIMVGMMMVYQPIYGLTCNPDDQLLALHDEHTLSWYADVQMRGVYPRYKLQEYKRNGIEVAIQEGDLEILKNYTCDFLSFSCYGSICKSTAEEDKDRGNGIMGIKNPFLETNAWGWATDPNCIRIACNQLYDRYQKPLWVVENGIGWEDEMQPDGSVHDTYRIDYLRHNIKSMRDAINIDGIPLMGYTMWGCIDLVSAGTGEMRKRYGFVYVDMDDEGNGTLQRSRKDSFYYYQKVIASQGADLD